MLIVVEGVDGSGKSTLCAEIAQRTGAETRHLSQPTRHPLEETVLDLDWYTPGNGEHVVVDRFHLGEMVYGPLYRGVSQLGELGGPEHRWIDMWLMSRGGVLAVLDAELDVLQARLGTRGEDFLQTHHVEHVRDFYREAAATWNTCAPQAPDLLRADMQLRSERDTRRLARRLVEHATAMEKHVATAFAATKGRYLGRPHPNTLLVGEETSPTHLEGRRPIYLAPFVPYRGTSGHFLLGALQRPGSVAIVNALEVDLDATYHALDCPTVVALGRIAHLELERHDITHARVPHPQWVRRFKHARKSEYGALITKAGEEGEGDFSRELV